MALVPGAPPWPASTLLRSYAQVYSTDGNLYARCMPLLHRLSDLELFSHPTSSLNPEARTATNLVCFLGLFLSLSLSSSLLSSSPLASCSSAAAKCLVRACTLNGPGCLPSPAVPPSAPSLPTLGAKLCVRQQNKIEENPLPSSSSSLILTRRPHRQPTRPSVASPGDPNCRINPRATHPSPHPRHLTSIP